MEVWESSRNFPETYLPACLFYNHSYGPFGWIIFVEDFNSKNFLFLVVGYILLKQEKSFFQFSAKYIWHPNLNKQEYNLLTLQQGSSLLLFYPKLQVLPDFCKGAFCEIL